MTEHVEVRTFADPPGYGRCIPTRPPADLRFDQLATAALDAGIPEDGIHLAHDAADGRYLILLEDGRGYVSTMITEEALETVSGDLAGWVMADCRKALDRLHRNTIPHRVEFKVVREETDTALPVLPTHELA